MGCRDLEKLGDLQKLDEWWEKFVDALVYCYQSWDLADIHWTGRLFSNHEVAQLEYEQARLQTGDWFVVRMGSMGCEAELPGRKTL
jgi:hypothetical protein